METNPSTGSCCEHLGKHKHLMPFILIGAITLIVVLALLREKIVNDFQNSITFTGVGKVTYQPDTALVNIGIQVDKAPTADEALRQLNEKINRVIPAIKELGISGDDIQTQNYSLYPNYDFVDNVSRVSGYNANQQLSVKVKNVVESPDLISKVIGVASQQGINQINGITFDVSNLEQLKQEARLKAIEDAKEKVGSVSKALGIRKLDDVIGWYENVVQAPGVQPYYGGYGMGGEGGGNGLAKPAPTPQVPTGTQEIVIEVGLTYEVK